MEDHNLSLYLYVPNSYNKPNENHTLNLNPLYQPGVLDLQVFLRNPSCAKTTYVIISTDPDILLRN